MLMTKFYNGNTHFQFITLYCANNFTIYKYKMCVWNRNFENPSMNWNTYHQVWFCFFAIIVIIIVIIVVAAAAVVGIVVVSKIQA